MLLWYIDIQFVKDIQIGMKYLLNKVGIQAETVPCRIWDRSDNKSEFVSKNATNHNCFSHNIILSFVTVNQ